MRRFETLRGRERNHFNNKPRGATRRNVGSLRTLSNPTFLLDNIKSICEGDDSDILPKLTNQIENFHKLLSQNNLEGEVFFWVMTLANKISKSSFQQLKSEIILFIWNHQSFIANFQSYLTSLPYTDESLKTNNPSFWNDAEQFWTTFLEFCTCIIKFSPSVASVKCRCLLDIANLCLNGLESHCKMFLQTYSLHLKEVFNNLMKDLNDAMAVASSKKDAEKLVSDQAELIAIGNQEVPNNFREIPLIPNKSEIIDEAHPFVRPNITNGAYSSIDHYLDVQFRLLREDCFKGLRDGLRTFIGDNKRKKYDYIRIYKNVKFLGVDTINKRLGYIVQWQEKAPAGRRMNYVNSKRFMFGSLLVFSRDNFKSILLATVVDRDQKLLSKGLIMVNFQDGGSLISRYFNLPFVMVESQVYFEPYYHVLKALQSQDFAENFPMKKYIVDAEPYVTPPSYLTDCTTYRVTNLLNSDNMLKIPVLDFPNWPKAFSLSLNLSQYEAYKLALTREFAVIQGPPGTGKTYLGLMVARTLITNYVTTLTGPEKQKQMLVICYTNHALDQFLEGLLNVTSNIIRIGGQSKNKKLDAFNLSNLRGNHRKSHGTAYRDKMFELKDITDKIIMIQKDIQQMDQELCFEEFENWLESETDSEYENIKRWLLGNFIFARDVTRISFSSIEQTISVQNEQINELQTTIHTKQQEMSELQLKDVQKTINGLERKRKFLQDLLELLRGRLFRGPQGYDTVELNRETDVNALNQEDRWAVYFEFYKMKKANLWRQLQIFELHYKETLEVHDELKLIEDRSLLASSLVIGMTTTGAARLQPLLQSLQSPIVIIEEAAEVFEAHIVASLTRHCEHLILIGDHQQLRPSSACYEIGKRYGLEISLFERMIKNGIHCRTLLVQHRMRPEIASLIAPTIYKNLENHPSVERFPPIKGLRSSLYFIKHDHYEEKTDDEDMSRSNQYEANFLIKLAIYLRQQGYQPEEITILTAYNGQMFLMRQMQNGYEILENVLITAVDNYQGEENKIILLSLVRSNPENSIGFLATENRVCVALSRAKEGLFIIGNMDGLMKKSDLWNKINMILKNQNAISNTLILKCENHLESLTEVASVEDFEKVPEGGCLLICNKALPCGHICHRICHAYDENHSTFTCQDPCAKILCDLDHPCPGKCGEKCKECVVKVLKDLPCGHKAKIPCSMKPELYKCRVQTNVILPACGHENTKMCFMDDGKVPCKEPCMDRMPCGHACVFNCHKNNNPDHNEITCRKPCAKRKRGCSKPEDDEKHMCEKMCFQECSPCLVVVNKKRTACTHRIQVACNEGPDATPCKRKCTRSIPACQHHCTLSCAEPCRCTHKVTVTNDYCNHKVEILCGETPTKNACQERCERSLVCGHPCKQNCRDACQVILCNELVPSTQESPCGHKFLVPCNISRKVVSEWKLQSYCKEKCTELLECGHICGGHCSSCSQGRIHVPCNEPCKRILLCGHKCAVRCSEFCPPCKQPCEVKCTHSNCSLRCSSICKNCVERCVRKCEHRQCKKKCYMICSVGPCNEPCNEKLPCGHTCRGLCGEECPDICNICKPDDFPQDFINLTPFDDDAKFIKLIDCPHSMEVESLDMLMNVDMDDTVKIRSCPLCNKPIINTPRYEKLIKTTFDTDIRVIKQKIQGNNYYIKSAQVMLTGRASRITEAYSSLQDHKSWLDGLDHIVTYLKKKTTRLNQIDIEILQFSCYVMEVLSKLITQVRVLSPGQLLDALNHQIEIIVKAIINIRFKLSTQQQNDVKRQLRCLSFIAQYLRPKDAFSAVQLDEKVLMEIIKMHPFDEVEAKNLLKNVSPLTGYITIEEKNMIVKAMRLSQGHWYKCPNNHYYCIDACGGAMEVRTCPECKEAIGGSNHRLLASNRLASEMDGATSSAWPGGM